MHIAHAVSGLHLLAGRFGPRPRSSARLPFRQLDQFPPAEMQARLLERILDIEGVRARQSRVAPAQCRALSLPDSLAGGPAEAFIDGHEFCHLHPDGSIHLTLPVEAIEGVVAMGWAERHPLHKLGLMKSLVMVYAPRDAAELDVVMRLVDSSSRFARGGVAHLEVAARSVA
jgi:hypothetical protein